MVVFIDIFSWEIEFLSLEEEKEVEVVKIFVPEDKLQLSSKCSQEGAKGGSANRQAFQFASTGVPNCWQTPPRRPSG